MYLRAFLMLLALVSVVAMSALAAVLSNLRAIETIEVPEAPPLERADPAREELRVPARPVFRHSVIPRGAYTAAEVEAAMSRDRVVAAHYSGVNLRELRAETLSEVRAVYMSYRVGDRILWTKQKVRLKQAETILTDGVNYIRARCGNHIAFAPMEPTAVDEPGEMEFDTVTDEPEVVQSRVPLDTEWLPQPIAGIPVLWLSDDNPQDPRDPGEPDKLGYPGDPGDPGNPRHSMFLPPEDPVVVPEPATLLLVGGGLATLLARRHRRR